MKIKTVKHIGKDNTLDLEVNYPLHQFYCKGLLTSNSHSVAYTYVSYYEAWLKNYYMPEFYCSLFNNTDAKKSKKGENVIAQYLTDAMKKGFKINQPNVNKSFTDFTIDGDIDSQDRFSITFGLAWIKGLASTAIEKIIDDRKANGEYASLDDFFERLDKHKGRKVNKKDIDALLWSGAFDCFFNDLYEDRFDLHEYIWETIKQDKKYVAIKKSNDLLIDKEYESINISMKEIAAFAGIKAGIEKERGIIIDGLVVPEEDQGKFLCVGKVTKLENLQTKKKGADYVRINLRDETSELKWVYVWPWKCKGWDSLKIGMTVMAHIEHQDSGFKQLTGWSMVSDRSDYIIEAENKVIEDEKVETERITKKVEDLEKAGQATIMSIVEKLGEKYELEVDTDTEFTGRSNAICNMKVAPSNKDLSVLIFYYTDRKGFSISDLRAFRNSYDYLYVVRNNEEDDKTSYLYKTKDFKRNLLLAPKDKEGLRYPIFKESDSLPEEVLFNTLDNKV